MQRIFLFLLVFLFTACSSKTDTIVVEAELDSLPLIEDAELPAPHRTIYGIDVDSLFYERKEVRQGERLSDLIKNFDLPKQTRIQIEQRMAEVFDLRKMKAGNKYCLITVGDTLRELRYLVYEINQVEYVVAQVGDTVSATLHRQNITTRERVAEGVIETSLWNAIVGQGLQWELAMRLSDIYAWNIDFFGLQKGDMFRVRYTERWVDSTFIGIDTIKCAIFSHARHEYQAIPFEVNGRLDYFDYNGYSLRKAFLKAPLKYSRVSSTFSHSRLHPVLKIRRPHHGVDYAAPKGTPVMSIGDGRVIAKGYDRKGGGNYIKVQHNSTYTTAYLHLSAFAKGLAVGKQVKQSEVIGFVGSTGTSTGPHLDFRVFKNGTPTDPLKLDAPSAKPVPTPSLDRFIIVRDSLMRLLSMD